MDNLERVRIFCASQRWEIWEDKIYPNFPKDEYKYSIKVKQEPIRVGSNIPESAEYTQVVYKRECIQTLDKSMYWVYVLFVP